MPVTKLKPTVIRTTTRSKPVAKKVTKPVAKVVTATKTTVKTKPKATKTIETKPVRQLVPGAIVHPDGRHVMPEPVSFETTAPFKRSRTRWYVDVSILVIAICLVIWGLSA